MRHRAPQPRRRRRAAWTSSIIGYEPGGLGEPDLLVDGQPCRPHRTRSRSTTRRGSPSATTVVIGGTTYDGHRADRRHHAVRRDAGRVPADRGGAGRSSTAARTSPAAILLDGEPAVGAGRLPHARRRGDRRDAMRPLEGSVSSVNLIRVLLWFVAALIIGTMSYLVGARAAAATWPCSRPSAPPPASSACRSPCRACSSRSLAAGLAVVLQVVAVPVVPARGVGAGPGVVPGAGDRGARGAARRGRRAPQGRTRSIPPWRSPDRADERGAARGGPRPGHRVRQRRLRRPAHRRLRARCGRRRADRAARPVRLREDVAALGPRRDPPTDRRHDPLRRGIASSVLSGAALSHYRQRPSASCSRPSTSSRR